MKSELQQMRKQERRHRQLALRLGVLSEVPSVESITPQPRILGFTRSAALEYAHGHAHAYEWSDPHPILTK